MDSFTVNWESHVIAGSSCKAGTVLNQLFYQHTWRATEMIERKYCSRLGENLTVCVKKMEDLDPSLCQNTGQICQIHCL